jgi:hypothetical protein
MNPKASTGWLPVFGLLVAGVPVACGDMRGARQRDFSIELVGLPAAFWFDPFGVGRW